MLGGVLAFGSSPSVIAFCFYNDLDAGSFGIGTLLHVNIGILVYFGYDSYENELEWTIFMVVMYIAFLTCSVELEL